MASVKFMDQQVGRLLNALNTYSLRENTIVVFVSDHGYNLGEHDCWSKSSLWEGSVRVPMIISMPGEEYARYYGSEATSIVELIDLYPTLGNLTGLSKFLPDNLQGISLQNALLGKHTAVQDRVAYTITNVGNAASIRSARWRYNRWGNEINLASEELYDHQNDPDEEYNLVDNIEYNDILYDMRRKLDLIKEKAFVE
jgi:arylsulfatase A-like enzyme